MGTLSKVAAGAASIIPFHCVICFDEFNLTDRVPMVLPCGHTYVCHRCTQRLSRCMECREPLFLSVPSSAFATNPSATAAGAATAAGGRYSPLALPSSSAAAAASPGYHHHQYGSHLHHHSSHPPPPPPPMVKIPLSIPKNVVLISLMEAAQRQVLESSRQQAKQQQRRGGGDDDDKRVVENCRRKGIASNPNGKVEEGDDDDDDDDDSSAGSASDEEEEDDNEEFNLDRIISGMATLSGPCGTYAVTIDGQVVVQPNDPRPSSSAQGQEPPQRRFALANDDNENDGSTTPPPPPSAAASLSPTEAVPTSEEKKTDDLEAAGSGRSPAGVRDVDLPQHQQYVMAAIEDRTISSQEGIPLSPIQSAGSYASRADDDECERRRENDDADAGRRREPFVLRKGQTVQVVSLEDGVAKLARNMGYIVLGSPSHLVKVGGPIETVCRLEGLLGTIEGRGRDLQATLDENRQVEQSLLGQIRAEMQSQPSHPVITQVPDLDVWRHGVDSDSDDDEDRTQGRNKENVVGLATTPTVTSEHHHHPAGYPRTPDSRRDSGSLSVPGSVDSIESRTANVHSQSPMSIDNADLQRPSAIPVYRRTVSEDDIDQLVFGCGVAFLGDGSSGLFSATPNILAPFDSTGAGDLRSEYRSTHNPSATSSSSSYSSTVLASRPRSATDHSSHPPHDYAAPTLTSSFDGIDFRTGMSGHRGLNHVANKSGSSHYSPTPRYRNMRLMSEHRGIARPLSSRRDSPTTASVAGATVPAFGPRLSSFPHVGGGDDAAAAHPYR